MSRLTTDLRLQSLTPSKAKQDTPIQPGHNQRKNSMNTARFCNVLAPNLHINKKYLIKSQLA